MIRKKPSGAPNKVPLRALLPLAALLAAAVLAGVTLWLILRPAPLELPYLTARRVVVMDVDSGRILADVDGHTPHSPASLTKMMTVFLVLDDIERGKLSWEDTCTVTPAEAFTLGSKYGMRPGQVFTVRELVAGAIMVSGCDCIQCLVKLCAPSEADFVARMNEKAAQLGMEGSHFVNPTGIDASGHYMTARDVARLARALVREHPEILDFTSVPSLELGGRTFQNIHRLVGRDPRVKGLKTGTTTIGGFSVCTYAEGDRGRYLVVLMDSNSDATRFSETVAILDLLLGEG